MNIKEKNLLISGKKIGYIRVSTIDQNIDHQLEGVQLDKVYVDRCSGKNIDRPELQELINNSAASDRVLK